MESLMFCVKLSYDKINQLKFHAEISIGLRFSIWKDETNFTAAEVSSLMDNSLIKPGETCILIISVIPSEVSRQMQVGDKMFWGAGYRKIGDIEVLEQLR